MLNIAHSGVASMDWSRHSSVDCLSWQGGLVARTGGCALLVVLGLRDAHPRDHHHSISAERRQGMEIRGDKILT